jgi:diguanylate cyclase (GGDEF)-like protein
MGHRLTHLAVEIYLLILFVAIGPLAIVAGVVYFWGDRIPGGIALAELAQSQEILVQLFYAVLAFALLGALLFARRILHPLVNMLDVTKELSKRDVWGRADVRRRNKHVNFSSQLQNMADDLSQQFNARETLSSIDQVILSGADVSLIVDLVLRHIVESVQCRRAMITILGDENSGDALTAAMSRGHPVTRKNEVEISDQSRRWLADQSDGVQLSGGQEDGRSDPFIALDTRHTFVLPIKADGKTAAAVSIMTMDSLGLDDIEKGSVRDLAGRLAVALEAVSRSERLRRKAFFDDLTGLPNRDFCFARLDRAISQAKHMETAVAVMFVDLDGFKTVNDTLGHIAGDELIRQAAYRLAGCVGESGTVGRLGGDEFAIVLPFPVNAADPDKLSKRLIEVIAEPFVVGSSKVHVSASIGVSRFPVDGDTRAQLLRNADAAMYRAKESGRGQTIDYSHTMGVKVDERLRVESDLKNALENDEFQIYYQPQMDMRTGRIVSAEALLRWAHPERGLILPERFVQVAEDTGYLPAIGEWVLSNACEQIARWQEEGLDLERVSVNVSARQFHHHDFIDVVESCLLKLLSNAESLEIELTESVFVEDLNKARRTLERLKATGVYVSIDDFGTGYSSLGYLKHLTFDAVKVDQSFIHELPDDRKSEAIIRAVLAMCHTLGKRVVAEGIETDSQFHYLRKAKVDLGQGFRIGRPMQADQFAQYLIDSQQRVEDRLRRQRA